MVVTEAGPDSSTLRLTKDRGPARADPGLSTGGGRPAMALVLHGQLVSWTPGILGDIVTYQ